MFVVKISPTTTLFEGKFAIEVKTQVGPLISISPSCCGDEDEFIPSNLELETTNVVGSMYVPSASPKVTPPGEVISLT